MPAFSLIAMLVFAQCASCVRMFGGGGKVFWWDMICGGGEGPTKHKGDAERGGRCGNAVSIYLKPPMIGGRAGSGVFMCFPLTEGNNLRWLIVSNCK